MISSMRIDGPCCLRTARMVRPILASSLCAIMPILHPMCSSSPLSCRSPCMARTSIAVFTGMDGPPLLRKSVYGVKYDTATHGLAIFYRIVKACFGIHFSWDQINVYKLSLWEYLLVFHFF